MEARAKENRDWPGREKIAPGRTARSEKGMKMKLAWRTLPKAAFWLAGAVALSAAAVAAPDAPALAGHYYLEGVMETGSELLLLPDHRFQWYLSYGAMDLDATGRWSADGDKLTLTAESGGDERPAFDKLELEVAPDGSLHRPGDTKGAYRRHDDPR